MIFWALVWIVVLIFKQGFTKSLNNFLDEQHHKNETSENLIFFLNITDDLHPKIFLFTA